MRLTHRPNVNMCMCARCGLVWMFAPTKYKQKIKMKKIMTTNYLSCDIAPFAIVHQNHGPVLTLSNLLKIISFPSHFKSNFDTSAAAKSFDFMNSLTLFFFVCCLSAIIVVVVTSPRTFFCHLFIQTEKELIST